MIDAQRRPRHRPHPIRRRRSYRFCWGCWERFGQWEATLPRLSDVLNLDGEQVEGPGAVDGSVPGCKPEKLYAPTRAREYGEPCGAAPESCESA